MAFHVARLLLLLVLAVWIASPEARFIDLPVEDDANFRSSDKCRCSLQLYDRPVIGILSNPGDGSGRRLSDSNHVTNIPASYVKFVSSGGARVIPIIANEPEEDIKRKLDMVNGVLFTDGWKTTDMHSGVANRIFQMVLAKNDAGDHFPLFAVGLGFELLMKFVSKNNAILESFPTHHPSTLQLRIPETEGTLFERFPMDLLDKLSRQRLAMQNHTLGISQQTLEQNNALSNFFRVLTTSVDVRRNEFVSTAQAQNYPVTALQWLPEKNAFEWGSNRFPHSEDAVRVTQQTTNYFIRQARKSSARPDQKELLSYLIYNYKPTFSGSEGNGYDEVYIFE